MTKICKCCGLSKENTEKFFPIHHHKNNIVFLKAQCKECISKKSKIKWKIFRDKNPLLTKYPKSERVIKKLPMDYYNLRRYGIDKHTLDSMKKSQNNKCAICDEEYLNKKDVLCIDHNHLTGKIRGLLCRKCNMALGLLKADIGLGLLEKAINYIKLNSLQK